MVTPFPLLYCQVRMCETLPYVSALLDKRNIELLQERSILCPLCYRISCNETLRNMTFLVAAHFCRFHKVFYQPERNHPFSGYMGCTKHMLNRILTLLFYH